VLFVAFGGQNSNESERLIFINFLKTTSLIRLRMIDFSKSAFSDQLRIMD